MKLVLVSDIHGNIKLTKETVKLANKHKCSILCAGDLINWELKRPESRFKSILNILNKCKKKVYIIPGSHEDVKNFLQIQENEKYEKHLVGVVNGVIDLKSHYLVCYGGSDVIVDEIIDKTFYRIKPNKDKLLLNSILSQKKPVIFMTHIPPYSYLDTACFKIEKKKKKGQKGIYPADFDDPDAIKKHVGNKVLKKIIEKHKPLLYLFGHIHESRGSIELLTHKKVTKSKHLLVNGANKVQVVELKNKTAKLL